MDPESVVVYIGDPDGPSIVLSDAGDPFNDGYDFVDFTARISASGLTARSRVRSIEGALGLREFFRSLATDWRGWDGERRWESIEHDLSIAARADEFGHVRLALTLRESWRPDAWTTTVVVVVEAGQEMAMLSSTVDRFLRK